MPTAMVMVFALALAGCQSWSVKSAKDFPLTVEVTPDRDGTCGFTIKRPQLPGTVHAVADDCPRR